LPIAVGHARPPWRNNPTMKPVMAIARRYNVWHVSISV